MVDVERGKSVGDRYEVLPQKQERELARREFVVNLILDLAELPPLRPDQEDSDLLDEKVFIETEMPPNMEVEDLLAAFCNCGLGFEITGKFNPRTGKLIVGRSKKLPETSTVLSPTFELEAFLPSDGTVVFHNHAFRPFNTLQENAALSPLDESKIIEFQRRGIRFTSLIAAGAPGSNETMISRVECTGPWLADEEFYKSIGIGPSGRAKLKIAYENGSLFDRKYLMEHPDIRLSSEKADEVVRRRNITELEFITVRNKLDIDGSVIAKSRHRKTSS